MINKEVESYQQGFKEGKKDMLIQKYLPYHALDLINPEFPDKFLTGYLNSQGKSLNSEIRRLNTLHRAKNKESNIVNRLFI